MDNEALPQSMLLIRGDDEPSQSAEETQRIVQEYIAWARHLRDQDKMRGGDELAPRGKVVSGIGSAACVTDGPFAESKELIGGYFLIEATNEAEAVEIARECPGIKRGRSVEVRTIIDHSGS